MINSLQYFNDKSQHVCRVLALWSRKTFKESNVVDVNVGETWKQIPGVSQIYEVSDLGNVRVLKKNGKTKVLKKVRDRDGYEHVGVFTRSTPVVRRTRTVHRMVLLAFVGEPPTPKHQVAHWNGKVTDNRLCNLRWATTQENAHDRFRHGTVRRGSFHPNVKISVATAAAVKFLGKALPASAVAQFFGMKRSSVYSIRNGESWKMLGGAA